MSTDNSDKWYFIQRQDPTNNTFYDKPADRNLGAYNEQRMFRRWTGLKSVVWRGDSRAPRDANQMYAHGFHPQYVQGPGFDANKNRYPSQVAVSAFVGPAFIWRDSDDKKDVMNETTVCIARDIRGGFFFPFRGADVWMYAIVAQEGVNTYYLQKQDDLESRSNAANKTPAQLRSMELAWTQYAKYSHLQADQSKVYRTKQEYFRGAHNYVPVDATRGGRDLNKVWQFKERCASAIQPADILCCWKMKRYFRRPDSDSLVGIRVELDKGSARINAKCPFSNDDTFVNYVLGVVGQYAQPYPRDANHWLTYNGIVTTAGESVVKQLWNPAGCPTVARTDRKHMKLTSILIFFGVTATPVLAANCEELAKLALPNATVSSAQPVPAGTFTPPAGPPLRDLPAFCRVELVLKPSSDSHIEAEVWLPATGWNGKFHGVGNGGYAGSISFGGMAAVLARGYATASSDTGHKAGGTDAAWALGHPEKIVDFAYRAVHETAVQAKAIIKAFYGDAPKRAYFSSCSNGGRQALMEAQRYPADYDGIIAGAPAYYWTHLLTTAIWDLQALTLDPASFIPPAKLPAIQAAALAACDKLDGVTDGVIENPAKCHFDPSPLLCKGADSDSCLTAPQLAALKKIYTGPRTATGKQLMRGYSPGAEAGQGGWGAWITGPAPGKSLQFAFGTNFFRNMVYNDEAWDYKAFALDRDVKAADKMAPILNAADPDLKRFKDRGGKLILYHGWSDAAIPALATVDYYKSVIEKMGPQEAAGFVKLYMVPGMQHCGGGDGPSQFGQNGAGQGDALHNVDKALEQWVEQAVAPKQIVATKFKAAGPSSGVARTRPLCPYPQTAQWKGSGSTDDDRNFVCK